MIAREGTLTDLLSGNGKNFYIPVYQREYSWTNDQCKRLMGDIYYVIEHNLYSHFFGSIVYTNKDLAGISSYCVIDGQQRIITITLLLIAIYREVKNREEENCDEFGEHIISIDELKNNYFYINPYKKNPEPKLTLSEGDDELYRRLLLTNQYLLENKIGENYHYFSKSIEGKPLDEIKNILEVVKHLSIVNVSLERGDDPQRIFESLNSKILPLLESDKIRNFIFMNIDYEDQKILYKEYWKKITDNVNDVSKLARFYLVIKTNNFVPEKELYFKFKDFVTSQSSLTPKNILEELLKYSIYMKKINECNNNSLNVYQQSLYRLNKLDMSTIYPLVFICYDALVDKKESNYEITKTEFDEIMLLIESYIARRIFLKLSTGSLNKIFAFLPGEVFKLIGEGCTFKDAIILSICSKTANSRFPKDAEFKTTFPLFELYNAKSSFKKYVLERLENFDKKELIDVDNNINSGKLTIEHVMPQTLDESWKKYLGDDYETIHQKYLNTIGNLTLTAYNSEYSNLPFESKKTLPKKGFNYSSLFLNEYIKNQIEWKEKQINERAGLLLERALKIWEYPLQNNNIDFDILNPSTWDKVAITQLGRDSFLYLFDNCLLSDEEVEGFKTLEYSKRVLKAYYPILSPVRENKRDPLTGKKLKTHWKKDPINYNGEVLYLTIEWFDSQFDALTNYLKSKLKL